MKNFVTIHLFKAFKKVNYYTFWVEGKAQAEADSFFARFEENERYEHDLNLLATWIGEIGASRGAKARYFRFENDASALPPPARIMAELGDDYCSLWLYCVRLSDEIVVLANGGLKTGRTVQDSPDLLAKFRFANKMAHQLLDLIQTGEIQLVGKEIVNGEQIELID